MPRVFLSHSSLDRLFIDNVLLPILHQHGIETWYCKNDIHTAEEWEYRIRQGLKECDWFLVIISENAVTSRWLKAEVRWAFDNRATKIIPLFLRDCNFEDINLLLPTLQYVDFRGDPMPGLKRLLQIWGKDLIPFTDDQNLTFNTSSEIDSNALPDYKTKSSVGLTGLTLTEQLYILCAAREEDWSESYTSGHLTRLGLRAIAVAELIIANKATLPLDKPYHPLSEISFQITDQKLFKNDILNAALLSLIAQTKGNPISLSTLELHAIFETKWLLIQFEFRKILVEFKRKILFGLTSVDSFILVADKEQKEARNMLASIIASNIPFSDDVALFILIANSCGILDRIMIPGITKQQKDAAVEMAHKNSLAILIERKIQDQIDIDYSIERDNDNGHHIACS